MFVPYRVDVPFDHAPVMNRLVFGAVILVFCLQVADLISAPNRPDPYEQQQQELPTTDGNEPQDSVPGQQPPRRTIDRGGITDRLILDGWRITGLFGHMWLHGGLFHLIGNLIFLWLFGNAVCSKIGNLYYLPVYIGLGLAAGIVHLIFVGGKMLGASGAINGLVGMYLVFFPENSISCFFWVFYYPVRFSLSGYWIILIWFAFDLLGVMLAEGQAGGVAYFAHVGGFLTGFALAIAMLATKLITMERDEKSLLELLGLDKSRQQRPGGELAYWQQQMARRQAEEELETGPPKWPKPEPTDDFIRFRCFCGQKIKVPKVHAGRMGRCPGCSKRIKVPEQ
ncbi:MAG: rhomboid family intramembrane serine protease [Phycisphaerales bacterium]|nr:MAG: rhomboid family intramembrane serine protease [Phycisphaerales bacterium]